MDHSPWSVQGHCLNLRECQSNRCVGDVDFRLMQIWIQVFGLSLDMFNEVNGRSIGNMVGNCLEVEEDRVMK